MRHVTPVFWPRKKRRHQLSQLAACWRHLIPLLAREEELKSARLYIACNLPPPYLSLLHTSPLTEGSAHYASSPSHLLPLSASSSNTANELSFISTKRHGRATVLVPSVPSRDSTKQRFCLLRVRQRFHRRTRGLCRGRPHCLCGLRATTGEHASAEFSSSSAAPSLPLRSACPFPIPNDVWQPGHGPSSPTAPRPARSSRFRSIYAASRHHDAANGRSDAASSQRAARHASFQHRRRRWRASHELSGVRFTLVFTSFSPLVLFASFVLTRCPTGSCRACSRG